MQPRVHQNMLVVHHYARVHPVASKQKISKGEASFVQINFRESAEGTTILGGCAGMSLGKFCKITPKNTHFCAFWKHFLDNTVFTFFYF